MIIGYARVSTFDQNLDRQIHSLTQYGCEKIIKEKCTGIIRDRQGLETLFDVIRKGDTVVVKSISRLGRKTLDILHMIQQFEIAERVKEGLEASKKRGKKLGRPKLEKDKLSIALRMYDSKEYSIKEIVEATGISQGSLYRAINQRKLEEAQR
ncbi:recombinase family protein [Bacillus toyonensis]|uniref:recombinase family protein n=1 Tax=Bacillus toyonensis TaxID=155322 RepID=UPI003D213236